VSEKLAAFVKLYGEKAAADVERAKENVKKSEDKLKKANELWASAKTEVDKLGITNKFLSVFPEPGGDVIAIVGGTTPNSSYTELFGYGDPLETLVRDLSKNKNAKARLENSKNNLAFAESLTKRAPEEHISILGNAIVSLAASTSSLGGSSVDSFLKKVFSDYEAYSEDFILELGEGVSGPSHVNSSQAAFDLLKEKFEAGKLVKKKEEETEKKSPINEPTGEKSESDVVQPNINSPEKVETKQVENTTEGTSTVTESKPEVVKAETPVSTGTNINLNLEKTAEKPAETVSSGPVSAPINQPVETPTSPINVEPTGTTLTQQSVDLSKTTNVSESTINSQSGIENAPMSNAVSPSTSTSSETTINQTELTSENKKPGLFKRALSAAGKALSPLAERIGEDSKDLLKVATSRPLVKASINTINRVLSNREKETTGANALNLTQSSPTTTQTNTTNTNTATDSPTVSNITSTTNQPSIETKIEKVNPSVEGKPTTATVENKTETQIQQPISTQSSPTVNEVKSPTPTNEMSPTQQPQPQSGSSLIDISSLEKRLKKIELALTNPLEVIIKDH